MKTIVYRPKDRDVEILRIINGVVDSDNFDPGESGILLQSVEEENLETTLDGLDADWRDQFDVYYVKKKN